MRALIYKIMSQADWRTFEAAGVYDGSADDARDGFIHFSSAEQLRETAAKHFGSRDDLMLLVVDAGALGEALKWEPSRGGALFPHLYGPLPLIAVNEAALLPLDASGGYAFPETIPE
jgi:uncharacterized protein (DUF952 family)